MAEMSFAPSCSRAEADQRERACHGDAGSDAAVDHDDDGGHNDGQDDQREQKAAAGCAVAGEGKRGDSPAEAGAEQVGRIDAHGKLIGQDRPKD